MFDLERFQQAQLSAREGRITVPGLAPFFKGEPVCVVRQLTGYEMARCQEAVKMNRDLSALVAGLVSDSSREKVDAIRKALGVSDSVPDEIAKRLEMLVIAGVNPAWDREAAVKLCTHYPVEFYQITTEVIRLTGEGATPGESISSTSETTSEAP